MIALSIIIGYLVTIFGFCLWDAWIGMGVNWDSEWTYPSTPPRWLCAIVWPISIPIIMLAGFAHYIDRTSKKRVATERHQEKVRIAAQQELDKYNQEVEEEVQKILHERKDSNQA